MTAKKTPAAKKPPAPKPVKYRAVWRLRTLDGRIVEPGESVTADEIDQFEARHLAGHIV